MTEVDAQTKISNYRRALSRSLDIETEQRLDELIEDFSRKGFINPTPDTPVSAFELAAQLDTKPLLEFFRRESYKNFEVVEERLEPRIRFFVAVCIGKYKTVLDAYRTMMTHGYWRILGFREPPTYELLREFCYERIGIDRYREFFDCVVIELKRQAESQGVHLGRRIGQDATDTVSLKYDKEAKYSGYYKHAGYKVDYAHDLDDPTVVLDYTPMHITDDEGQNLIPTQERLREKGFSVKEHKVDGSYVKSYKNIAVSETSNIRLIYRIQEGWVYNEKGTEENVKRTYQKYHDADDFKVNASLGFMLEYLCEKKEYEVVGSYFRNQRMMYAENNPELAKKETGERSNKTEGSVSVSKGTTLLDSRPRRRGLKEFVRRCGLSMLSRVFAALIRIQHGVKTALGCVTYIT